jgi:hypothetical protein
LYDSTGRIYAIGEYLPISGKEMEESRARSDKFTMSSEMMIIASSTHFIKINPLLSKY